ncbi:HPr kinase/phosphorylase [Paracoccus rhizosphaerae]|uniref:HPr kinase/phosphorylase n=1 Tax=Paracoccus rhizosphaerae TaxID=1133347 RepID=A0ABV6CGG4_9RHOB|nr:serine kinase [Paracoccus rhizosphaerae]
MQLHATTVALEHRALVILGPAGSGKSTLALQLMAVGAVLVADDRTDLRLLSGLLMASAPPQLQGRIEARGVGILAADPAPPTCVTLACDLGRREEDRLPHLHVQEWLGVPVPLVLGPYRTHLYASLRQMLVGQRLA